MTKKIKTIILAVTISVVAALLCVLLFLVITGKILKNNENSLSSSQTSSASSTENTVSEVIDFTEEFEGFEIYGVNKNSINTTENIYTFSGRAGENAPLTLNSEPVDLSEEGLFSVTVDLNIGKNTFTFLHGEKSYVYTVNYRFVILKEYYPNNAQTYSSGSTLAVSAKALKGSTVTATFNGQVISLSVYSAQDENANNSDSFCDYIGTFQLPTTSKNTNLGEIRFDAYYLDKCETFYSGKITCKKAEITVTQTPNAAPLGGNYIDVGTGKITEIVAYEAETFDAYSTNDWSRPTNNYLPKGTVDYSAEGYYYYQSSSTTKEYALLRCGRQVYTSKKIIPTDEIVPVVKEYAGTLPDHNEITIAAFETVGNHTVLTLDTLWKAPFYLDLKPQSYTNPSKQDYSISSITCEYVDITFCYATSLTGEITIPETNPVFSSAKIIKNQSDYTLRLYLREKGGFYGWDANYNEKGQLCFEFLNPARVTKSDNAYGAKLDGVKILIDVGHGGKDPGAVGFNSLYYSEANRNLELAKKIKAELESMGATVYMTRTTDVTSSNDDKIKYLKQIKPDYCIAVHHDASSHSSPNGFGGYYSQPFSKKAAELVYNNTMKTGFYRDSKFGWHYYYMARSSYCPVVLTENGFITNTYDFGNITSDSVNTLKAKAIAKGIAEYFLLYSPDDVPLPKEPEKTESTTESTPNSSQTQTSSQIQISSDKTSTSSTVTSSDKTSSSSTSSGSSSSGSSSSSNSSSGSSVSGNSSSQNTSSNNSSPNNSSSSSTSSGSSSSGSSSSSNSSSGSSISENSSSQNTSSSNSSSDNSSSNSTSSESSNSDNSNSDNLDSSEYSSSDDVSSDNSSSGNSNSGDTSSNNTSPN